jgi:hypothetical protein
MLNLWNTYVANTKIQYYRVVAVECESSNTIVVPSEEEQSSKVKRRKTGKSESQTNSKTNAGAVHAVAPKSSITKSAKPLSKVGEPSNKSKSAGGTAFGVASTVGRIYHCFSLRSTQGGDKKIILWSFAHYLPKFKFVRV